MGCIGMKSIIKSQVFRLFISVFIIMAATCSLSGQALNKSKTVPIDPKKPLKFAENEKKYHARKNEKEARFVFKATNISSQNVLIEDVQTSCGCTSVMKKSPWIIKPGQTDYIEVRMDLLGRTGVVTKSVYVFTNKGLQSLKVQSIIPGGKENQNPQGILTERKRNQLLALRDRQIVFKGKCAKCHVTPTRGLTGEKLYQRGCGICHNSPNRASMVPDLAKLDKKMDRTYWEVWIKYGRKGSLMPAFHKSQGGPLDDKQIESLVQYLLKNKPTGIVQIPHEQKMEPEKKSTTQEPEKNQNVLPILNFDPLKPVPKPKK